MRHRDDGRRGVRLALAWVALLVLGALAAATAVADTVIGAKVQCQAEYGFGSDTANACERGVDLAAGTPNNLAFAVSGCIRDDANADKAVACRRGVALHARLATHERDGGSSSFTYSWKQGHGVAQVEIGDYDLLVGDAEKSMGDCLRSFEGSKEPPSCLSGLRLQHTPPADAR
jgi:hypothetical protein